MADQHNVNIPALANTIAADIPDIKENLEFHKDVFENFVGTWSNTVATGIYPVKFKEIGTGASVLQCTIVEIGDWNMDATDSVDVAHGLTLSKIRCVSAMIRDDAGTTYFPVTPGYVATNAEVEINIQGIGAANITLNRKTGGDFDGGQYNSTSYNRGWITIWHTV